jgi:hypothetical protein
LEDLRYWALKITAARRASTPSSTRRDTTNVSVPARAPQRKQLHCHSGRARRDDRDEEGDQQNELEDREVPVRLVEAAKAERSFGTVSGHQGDQRRRAAEAGGEKQSTEHPRVAPDRLVADAEEHTRIGREEQGEDATDDVEGSAQDPAHRTAGIAHGAAVSPVEHERPDIGDQYLKFRP